MMLDTVIAVYCPKNNRLQDICDCNDPANPCPFYKGIVFYDNTDEQIIGVKCNQGGEQK